MTASVVVAEAQLFEADRYSGGRLAQRCVQDVRGDAAHRSRRQLRSLAEAVGSATASAAMSVCMAGAATTALRQNVMCTCSPLSDQTWNLSSADRNIEGDRGHVNSLLKSDLSRSRQAKPVGEGSGSGPLRRSRCCAGRGAGPCCALRGNFVDPAPMKFPRNADRSCGGPVAVEQRRVRRAGVLRGSTCWGGPRCCAGPGCCAGRGAGPVRCSAGKLCRPCAAEVSPQRQIERGYGAAAGALRGPGCCAGRCAARAEVLRR